MNAMTFGPDEEKLALAFEHITRLQAYIAALKAQLDVDALAIAALMNLTESPARLRDAFQQVAATKLTDDALRLADAEHRREAVQAAAARVQYWNDALDALRARGPLE